MIKFIVSFFKYFLLIVSLFVTLIVTAQNETKISNDPILTVVDEMPSFPGGEIEMVKFLSENLKYPKKEKEAHISGKCFLTFIVEKNGKINEIKVLKGVTGGPGCDKEAIRVVKSMPSWSPGKQNGEMVRVQYNLPIKFTLLSTDDQSIKDTIYLNSDWLESSKDSAQFYRLVSKHDDGYLVKDFYLETNKPYMIAVCNEIKPLMKNGHCTYFFQTGQKSSEGEYVKDNKVGIWKMWKTEGADSSIIECFANNTYKNIYLPKSSTTWNNKYNVIYKIEEPARFPGGEEAMAEFIQQNVNFPNEEKAARLTGTCYVSFIIEKDGSLNDIYLLTRFSNAPGYNAEAVRVVSIMPKWRPGTRYGYPVRVKFNLPLKFTMRK